MKINKLRATFGTLNNDTIAFHDGLNVVYAPNESGKSTWCAFICAMLYGLDTSERHRPGYIPDKQKYAPWSGAPMEGTMELTADKCEITLTRRTLHETAPMKDFSAVYTGSNIAVEGMTGTNVGEMLTGVSKDVFRRSAFVEQGAATVTGSPELEKRIQSIISTGEEEISYSEAVDRLKTWQRTRRYGRKGLLPDLEARIDEKKRMIEEVENASSGVISMKKELETAEIECIELENRVKEARRTQREELIRDITEARENVKILTQEYNKAHENAGRIRDGIRGSVFGTKALTEVEARAEKDLARLDELKAKNIKNSPLLMIVLMVITIVLAAVYERLQENVFLIIAAVFCAGTLTLLLLFMKKKRQIDEIQNEICIILSRYKTNEMEKITEKLDEFHALNVSLKKVEAKERETKEAYDAAIMQVEQLENAVIGELESGSANSETIDLGKRLVEERQKVITLTTDIASENGRLMTLGDPVVLGADVRCMEEETGILRNEYDAITLAIDTLKEADDEIQSRFSPELGKIAAEYMSEVTGGKYEEVLLGKDFSARARAKNDSVARESEYLSAGTFDLLYLAVRLAVCELALPEGETCPLIIDDALVNLDEERFSQAMDLLREIARDRQVILFTCRK